MERKKQVNIPNSNSSTFVASITLKQNYYEKNYFITGDFIRLIAYASAQSADLNKWINKTQGKSPAVNQQNKVLPNNPITEAGKYLEKSAKYQYAAILLSAITSGCTIGGACITENKAGRNACYIGAGVCSFAAICCQITAIDYKLKAARSLKLFANGAGGGLAYTF